MSVEPKLLYQPQELAGSVATHLPRRRGRVGTVAGVKRVVASHDITTSSNGTVYERSQ